MNKKNQKDDDSVFSDDSKFSNSSDSEASISNSHTFLFKKSNLLFPKKKNVQPKVQMKKSSSFESQFDLQKNESLGFKSLNSQIRDERELTRPTESKFVESEDLTYGITNAKDFFHNNMSPFFSSGSNAGGKYNSMQGKTFSAGVQRRVETFTGSLNSPSYMKKQEQRPLFNPIIGMTNIYGMPNMNDEYVKRVTPGREKRNELPFVQIRQTPGMGLNFNENATHGFHDDFRILPKTVDDLRIASKPKISVTTPMVAGLKGSKRGIIGIVPKNRPETFFENNPEDMRKSLSVFRAPTIQSKQNVPQTKRQFISGKTRIQPLQGQVQKHTIESLRDRRSTSFKREVEHAGPTNITMIKGQKAMPINPIVRKNTMRSITGDIIYLNPATAQTKGPKLYDEQNYKTSPTLKDITINNEYVSTIKGPVNKFNPANRKSLEGKTTLRQLNQNVEQMTNVKFHDKHIAYNRESLKQAPTLKQIHMVNSNMNNIKGHSKGVAYNKDAYTSSTTLKQINLETEYVQPIAGQTKSYVLDEEGWKPQATMKQIYQDTNYVSAPSPNEKSYVTNYERPRTTMKEININTARADNPEFHSKGGYQVAHGNIHYAPTQRQQATEYITHAGGQSKGGYQTVNEKNASAKTTKRQLTQNVSYIGGPEFDKKGAYDNTQKNIHLRTTHRQTTQNTKYITPISFDKGGMYKNIQHTIKPKNTMRQIHQNSKYVTPIVFDKGGMYKNIQNTIKLRKTMRQIHGQSKYITPVGFNKGGAYQINHKNTKAKTTLRQITQNVTRLNPAIHHGAEKSAPREDVSNMLLNDAKEASLIIRDAGAPTPSNYTKIPDSSMTKHRVKEMINIERDMVGDYYQQNPFDTLGVNLNQKKNGERYDTDRFFVRNNLGNNPFVNNVIHKSSTSNEEL